ncbi:hypothetical protein GQ457_18G007270 [Hibiscus cannabinus]
MGRGEIRLLLGERKKGRRLEEIREREKREKNKEGRGFAPVSGHRKGGGIHLHHHQVQLVETSRPPSCSPARGQSAGEFWSSEATGWSHTHPHAPTARVGLCRRQLSAHSFCAPQPHWISAHGYTDAAIHRATLEHDPRMHHEHPTPTRTRLHLAGALLLPCSRVALDRQRLGAALTDR